MNKKHIHKASFTEKQNQIIISLVSQDISKGKVARILGVSKGYINRITDPRPTLRQQNLKTDYSKPVRHRRREQVTL